MAVFDGLAHLDMEADEVFEDADEEQARDLGDVLLQLKQEDTDTLELTIPVTAVEPHDSTPMFDAANDASGEEIGTGGPAGGDHLMAPPAPGAPFANALQKAFKNSWDASSDQPHDAEFAEPEADIGHLAPESEPTTTDDDRVQWPADAGADEAVAEGLDETAWPRWDEMDGQTPDAEVVEPYVEVDAVSAESQGEDFEVVAPFPDLEPIPAEAGPVEAADAEFADALAYEEPLEFPAADVDDADDDGVDHLDVDAETDGDLPDSIVDIASARSVAESPGSLILPPSVGPELPGAAGAAAVAVASVDPTLGSVEQPTSSARRWWWWPSIAGVGVVLLAVQVFWLQFDSWSKDMGLRPYYQSICGAFGCELPDLRDVGAIYTKKMVVRSVGDEADRLLVDAVIVNQAPFAQDFPTIEIRFTSLRGHLIAGIRYTPKEYLSGELKGERKFEPDTPVRISMEVDDPGPAAVNYRLDFR